MTTLQLIFVIIVPIVVLLIIGLFIVGPLLKRKHIKKFKEYYYKKVRYVSDIEDFYLINNFSYKVNDNYSQTIDHILFGNKYIYVIMDYRVNGHLTGDQNDINIVINKNNGEKAYYPNPLIGIKKITESLSAYTEIDTSMFIGISLINDEYNVGIVNTSSQYYIIQRNKFHNLIQALESRNIPSLNDDEMHKAVIVMSKLKEKENK